MLVQGAANVQVNQRVTAQHQRGLIEEATEVLYAAHAPGRAKRFWDHVAMLADALIGIANLHAPALAVTEILLDLVVVIRHVDHDLADAVARQMFNQVLHHRLAQNWHHRFWQVFGQWPHPRALARSQNHALSHR